MQHLHTGSASCWSMCHVDYIINTLNTKRDLNSQLCPPALGHTELLDEAFPSAFHTYSELIVVHNPTPAWSSRLHHSSPVKQMCPPKIKSALELQVT